MAIKLSNSVDEVIKTSNSQKSLNEQDLAICKFLHGWRLGASYLTENAGTIVLMAHAEPGGGFVRMRQSANIRFTADPDRFNHTPYQIVITWRVFPGGIAAQAQEFGTLNNIVILDGRTIADVVMTADLEITIAWIDRDFLDGWAAVCGYNGPALRDNLRQISDDGLVDLIKRWENIACEVNSDSLFTNKISFTSLITNYIVQRYSGSTTKENADVSNYFAVIKKIDSYLIKNIDKRIEIEHLCRHLDISIAELRDIIFKTKFCSPYNYIQQSKMKFARFMLSRTNSSISQITYDLGFSSQAHFGSVFKKFVKISPANFRKLGIAGEVQTYMKLA
jgi:AraC-like DNA-binding protein